MQIFIVILAILSGLTYNYYFTGFHFSPLLCLFAGFTLIMPSLLLIHVHELKVIFEHKRLIVKNILLNYTIVPVIAMIIGLFTQDFGIASALFLLSVLAGGGMVMQWISQSKANLHLGIIFMSLYVSLYAVSFILFKLFGYYILPFFEDNPSIHALKGAIPIKYAFFTLLIIPFITSRILLLKYFSFIPPLCRKYKVYISNMSIFVIIFYLFGLKNSHLLFEIAPLYFVKAFFATLIFYVALYTIGMKVYDMQKAQERTAFLFLITRYITIALAISAFSVQTYGPTFILPIMMAYFIQISMASYFSHKFTSQQ